MNERRLCLVTGASAGIGRELARVYASHGYDLALTARRTERLEELADELLAKHGAESLIIPADLHDPAAPKAIIGAIEAKGLHVDALINNAGYGLPGAWSATSWDDQARFIQIMVTACCELAHRVWPGMLERNYGRVMNIASMAGVVPGAAGHTLYAPSKAFLIKFSESLHAEARQLGKDNVHALALCPGYTYSEFHDVNKTRKDMEKLPKYMWLKAEQVARDGYEALEAGRTPRCIPGAQYKVLSRLNAILPYSMGVSMAQKATRRARRMDADT